MYEITYEENTCLNHIPESVGSHYDFTFENRYDISHRPKKNRIEYTAHDRTTGLIHVIMEVNTPVDASEYPRMIPEILRHTGDPRYNGAGSYPPDDLIDVIFRAVMPAYGYAVREQQVEMAKSIYHGLSAKKATLCEAEVGTGKTMAYLVAGFAAKLFDKSYSFMGCPVTITTSSIELQKSIMEKEIPALSKMLLEFGLISKPLTAVLRKGKEHYFCPKRYHEYIDSLNLHPQLYSKTIQELLSAELLDKALDLDGLPLSPHIKSRICVKGSCRNCPKMGCCKYANFLDYASAPYRFDFQVTNHTLFLTAQKMRKNSSSKGRLLPCNFCIVDEAHKLSETAVDVFGAEITFNEVDEYLCSVKYNGGSIPKKRMKYKMLLAKANRLNKKLLSMFAHYKFKADEDICEVKIEMTPAMHDTIKKLISALKQIDKWSVLEGSAGGNTAISLTERLSVFLVRKNNMFWISYDKSTDSKALCCTPTNLKQHLQDSLWLEPNTHYALTSGTMKDDTGFSFFEDELGIIGCLDKYSVSEFSCESPFDYKNHTRLYISESTPIPDMHDPDYIPAVAKEIVQLIKATHGHTAVLFTSYKTLNAVYDLVACELSGYPLIKMSRSNKNAITLFKESGNGVLFASGSMWEGVDCAGDILSSVIIVRLPFPLRTQAMEFKKRACGNTKEFVQRYAVPQMIIKLRQGAGRLIRTETDTGVLAILDARAAKNGAYRSRVLKALRKYPLVSTVQQVASFIDSVKDESYKKEVLRE